MTAPVSEGPLSFVQEEILARMLAHPEFARRYDLIQIVALDGPLDTKRLEEAVMATVDCHPILRTRVRCGTMGWVQAVCPARVDDILHTIDEPSTPDAFAARLHRAKHDGPAVLAGAPLFRLYLAPASDGGYLLGVLVHHLVIDSAGYRVLWQDISAVYNRAPLLPPPGDYIAHARAEREAFEAVAGSALAFYKALGVVEPPSHAVGAAGIVATARRRHALDETARAGLAAAARRHRMSPFLVALAATGQAFARSMGRDQQLMTTDFENREAPAKRRHVAPFINSRICVLRDVDGPLEKLLGPLREIWLDAEVFRDVHIFALRQHLAWPEPLSVQLDAGDAEALPTFDGIVAQSVPDATPEPYWRDALLTWYLGPGKAVLDIVYRPERLAPDLAGRLGPVIEDGLRQLC